MAWLVDPTLNSVGRPVQSYRHGARPGESRIVPAGLWNPMKSNLRLMPGIVVAATMTLVGFVGRTVRCSAAPASASTVAPTPSPSTTPTPQGRIVILVAEGEQGDDQVCITYPNVVPHTKVNRDVKALASSAGWSPTNIEITDDKSHQISGASVMTAAVFNARVIDPQGHYFTLEPIVTAMRNYPLLSLVYFVGGPFDFQGLRTYSDKYVSIQLDQHGGAFKYEIAVHDSGFQKLNLPLYQAPDAPTRAASVPAAHAAVHTHRVRTWQVLVLAMVAALAGGTVYIITSRHT